MCHGLQQVRGPSGLGSPYEGKAQRMQLEPDAWLCCLGSTADQRVTLDTFLTAPKSHLDDGDEECQPHQAAARTE